MKTSVNYFKGALFALLLIVVFSTWLTPLFSQEEAPAIDLSKIQFKDTPLAKILEVIAGSSGMNIYLDEDVPDKKVSVFAKDQKLDTVLDLILETHDLCQKKVDENTIIVFPKKKTTQYLETETEIFFLTQAESGKLTSVLKNIGKHVQVFVDDRTNSLIFFGNSDEIEEARTMLDLLDRKNKQVLVDMKLLEVDRKKLKELGPTLTEGSTFSIDRLLNINDKNAPVLIKLIENIEDTRILAQPKIRVLDKEDAHITIADRIPIEITSSSQSPTGPVQIEKRVQWLDVGVKLQIEVLSISFDDDSIILKVTTEVSSLISITAAGYPQTRIRTAESILRARNGETVIMGGLISQDEIESWFKIPILSDIPLIGRAFTDKKKNLSESEIIMFLTPHIISTETAKRATSSASAGYTKKEITSMLEEGQGESRTSSPEESKLGIGVEDRTGEGHQKRSLQILGRKDSIRKLLERLRHKVETEHR